MVEAMRGTATLCPHTVTSGQATMIRLLLSTQELVRVQLVREQGLPTLVQVGEPRRHRCRFQSSCGINRTKHHWSGVGSHYSARCAHRCT